MGVENRDWRRELQQRPFPRTWLAFAITTMVGGVISLAIGVAEGELWMVVLGVLWLVLAPVYFWRWRRDRQRSAAAAVS